MSSKEIFELALFQSALPVWGEAIFPPLMLTLFDFNPLSPCGERLARGADDDTVQPISIHSPHAGRDDKRRGTKY